VGGGGLRCVLALAAEAAYPEGHPYRRVNDRPDDIEAITLADVQWFFQTFYGPANARLVLVGDFDEGAVRAQIDALFAPIRQRGNAPSSMAFAPSAGTADHVIDGVWPFANQFCATVWSLAGADAEERAALDVLHHHLVSLLRDRLVDASGIATAVFGHHDEREFGSQLTLLASFELTTKREKVLGMIDSALLRVSKHGLSTAALERATQGLEHAVMFAGESLVSRAHLLAAPRVLPRADPFEEQAKRYAAVSSESVQRAGACQRK
jgi:zinc protease